MLIYCICTQYLVGAPFALITAAWHGGDQFVALLRWYGSPGSLSVGHYELCRDDMGDLPGRPNHL